MESQPTTFKSVLLGLFIVAAIAAILVVLWKLTETNFLLGLFGVLTSVGMASYQYRKAKEREVEGRLFESKAKIYQGIADIVKDAMLGVKGLGEEVDEDSMTKRLIDYRAQMIVWSSIETLEAYDGLTKLEGKNITEIFKTMAHLYESMRKDLGHRDTKGAGLKIMLGNVTDANSMEDLLTKTTI